MRLNPSWRQDGEEVEVTIKAKNYKDKTVKIPSKKRVFQFSLEKIKTTPVVTNNNIIVANNSLASSGRPPTAIA